MMAAKRQLPLIERLPALRGEVRAHAPLAPFTWFRVGGPAEVLVRPADEDDLVTLLRGLPRDVPVTVIGVASNLLIRDGGIPGVVVRIGRNFAGIELVEGGRLLAGAGAVDINVARAAAQAGLGGLEFLSGVPGTIGGGLRMNAGAYGREIADVLIEATAVDRRGVRHRAPAAALGLGYRHSSVPDDWIFTSALLQGEPTPPDVIAARMAEIGKSRIETQPVRARTGGSTFKNPSGCKAWELIDAAGCRGLRRGGAQVSEQHCNFLINTGDATAADLEALGEEVRDRVWRATGVTLEWEIRRIGRPNGLRGTA